MANALGPPRAPRWQGAQELVRSDLAVGGRRESVVFDAGALIALERGLATVRGHVRRTVRLVTSAAVVAQVWRGGAARRRLARFLAAIP